MFRIKVTGFFVLAYFVTATVSEPTTCEPLRWPRLTYNEGVIGELREFPWLGVIKVHLYEGKNYKMAATGAVMIKENHVLASADDIVRIPRHVFLDRSKAMFLLKDNEQSHFGLKEYIAHPEYEYETFNTVAIVELVVDEGSNAGLPVCWPKYLYNTSNELYAIGYTDEHKLLQKVIYKMQYLNLTVCAEFYHRYNKQKESIAPPTHYHCGFAPNNKSHCEWDNGMVMASNSTGIWMIIGLGIKGPGCAAPSRFIDLSHYFNWIDSMTETEDANYYGGY